jgi:hypothetical protein
MPRFFFDLQYDGEPPTRDEEGAMLNDMDEAQIEAAASLTDLSREMIRSGKATNSLAVTVRDTEGPVLQARLNFEAKRVS